MKATTTYSTPCFNSYQKNVPLAVCTTTTNTKTKNLNTTATTTLKCTNAIAVEYGRDQDDYDDDDDADDGYHTPRSIVDVSAADDNDSKQKQQPQRWRHKCKYNHHSHREETGLIVATTTKTTRGFSDMSANLRNKRCQCEYKNCCKHVILSSQLPSCKMVNNDIHLTMRMKMKPSATTTTNNKYKCHPTQCKHDDDTLLNLRTAAQISKTELTTININRINEENFLKLANLTKNASIKKSALEQRTNSTYSSKSSTTALHVTSTNLSSTLATISQTNTTTASILKTTTKQSCILRDNISLSNKRQLVMPIKKNEENRLGNVGVVVEENQLFHDTDNDDDDDDDDDDNDGCHDHVASMMATSTITLTPQQHRNIQENNVPTHKINIQWRHRILSRPIFMSLRVGMKEAYEYLATAIAARRNNLISSGVNNNAQTKAAAGTASASAHSIRYSQTTIKLDCRCFKEINSDNCMVADRKADSEVQRIEAFSAVVGNSSASVDAGAGDGAGARADANTGTDAVVCDMLTYKSDERLRRQRHQECHYQLQQFNFLATLSFLLRKGMRSSLDVMAVPPSSTNLMLLTLVMLTLASPSNCWTGRPDVPTNCTFPARWEGSWFLSGYQQSIHIKGSQFSYRGKCAASDGNKYLIVDEKGCHRCLVIYEKHKNVLQYKESECEGDSMYMHQTNPSAMAMRSVLKQSEHRGGAHPNLNNNNNNNNNGHSRLSSSDQYIMRSYDDMNDCPPDFCKGRETLQNLCDQIPGDALLYSLFRESAEPVKCPLKGPFIFTYNRGHGECKNPVSNIESCTEDSRLLLSFQACPDVQGTESTVEELTCLATWKDGNSRYLVGLVSHHHAISNEERYRCFVYEKISSLMGGPSIVSSKDAEYKLAQSGDATCNGLDSAEVGSRIMSLRKPPITERCDFPVWFKGPRHWHVLMGNAVYNYHPNDGSVHIIKSNGFMETRALCEQINKQTSTEMMAVVHYTTGCQSGFMCMMFYRRDTHVIEIQTGKQASRLEDACAQDHFDMNRMPYITLLASNPDPQICPMEGLYNLRGAIGPPYLSTRHKRNHNNKIHSSHGHHHGPTDLNIGSAETGNGYAHKRHAPVSLRNTETNVNTRSLAERNRRAASQPANKNITNNNIINSPMTLEHMNILENIPQKHNDPTNRSMKDDFSVGKSIVLKNVDRVPSPIVLDNDLMRQRNRRDAPGCVTNYKAQRSLWVGCTEPDVIDVRPLCTDDGDEEYSCHGSWSENGTVYIIARHKGTKHGVCLSYRPTEGTAAKLVIGDACYRGIQKPPDHHLVANLTIYGKCGETGSNAMRPNVDLIQLAVSIYILLLFTFNTINIKNVEIQR